MEFLDREAEFKRLERLSRAGKGGFVAVWGRRRIGKSELLKRWCRKANGLYTVADRSSAAVQRVAFSEALSIRFPGFKDAAYANWRALFEALTRRARAENWHGPLVLDEFPYWVESDGSVTSVLQNWIDNEVAEKGILLAIAGSSQHMMQGIVLDADSPIYGRANEHLKLPPLRISFIREGLGITNALDAVRAYAVWGGVPRYWVAAESYGADVDTALDEQVLDPEGLLHEEPTTLLQSEIPSALSLKPYLDIIGAGANRVSEIASRVGLPSSTISKPLAHLVELGLVKREVPYGENEKNSKKSLYRIADPFCRMWFKVLASRRSIFDSSPQDIRLNIWSGLKEGLYAAEWEDLARDYVVRSTLLRPLAGENDYWKPAGRWWQGNAAELDVVATNGSNALTLIGEAKWSDEPYPMKEVKALAKSIKTRTAPPGLPAKTVYVLFIASVAADVPRMIDGVQVITAEDVIDCK